MVRGFSVRLTGVGSPAGLTVSAADSVSAAYEAVMMIMSGEMTVLVETVKDDESWPAGTITDAGTSATLESLDCRLTVALAVRAWASETVPVTGVLPTTAAGESVTVTAGFTSSVADAVELANVAVSVADS